MRVEPSHTPSELVPTHAPLKEYWPDPQMMQSFEVPPVHVSHDGEQGAHDAPLPKLPSGQTWPVDVADFGGMHFVRSFGS